MFLTSLMVAAQTSAVAGSNPFAPHQVHVPSWIAAVPAVGYVVGRAAWKALKRKAVAEHLRDQVQPVLTGVPPSTPHVKAPRSTSEEAVQ